MLRENFNGSGITLSSKDLNDLFTCIKYLVIAPVRTCSTKDKFWNSEAKQKVDST